MNGDSNERIPAFALLAFLFLALPSPSANAEGIEDCSEGCEIVTCDAGGICTIWYCDASGCKPIGVYTRPRAVKPQGGIDAGTSALPARPEAFAEVCEAGQKNPCAFKVCKDGRCDLHIFDGQSFVPVATTDDASRLLEQARKELMAPGYGG